MPKYTCTIIFLVITIFLTAAIDPQFTQTGNPELYIELHRKALDHLENLPQAQSRAFRKILNAQDDILMAFLIAYEADAKLAESEPQVVLSNYQEIVKLLMREGLRYPPEFFLSYIAKQSVSDERLSPYRKAMLDAGLADVALIEDSLARYRATASWCVEKLKFNQTSGRDQNPLDIISKSLTGRCEEMQILFVAAARTVGLPARPAGTPWWAHMDNNHAWAEVYLDGAWCYTGDMDAAYFPNQTWFSGMVDKTVLILADGSLPTATDEVLYSGAFDTVINSTSNYAKERTRSIRLRCLDSEGNALANCPLVILVYNWGALRPLTAIKTDEQGWAAFSAGSGDFFVSAYSDGKKALQLVRASEQQVIETTITLSEARLQAEDAMLYYPANQMTWQAAPDSYQEDIERRKTIRQNTLDSWSKIIEQSGIADSLGVAQESRGNFAAYREFYLAHGPLEPGFLKFLSEYDPKFLWQADAALFEAVYRFWLNQDPASPPQLFQPTVHYEELPQALIKNGIAQLYPDNFIQSGKSQREKMEQVLTRMKKLYQRDNNKALSGLLRLDVAASQKYLSDSQYRILAISMLRANGIPADFTRLPDNILVYLDEDWHYYDIIQDSFSDSADEAQLIGLLNISILDEAGLPLDVAKECLSLTRYVNGSFYTLNSDFEPLGQGKYRVQLPEDGLFLHFGYRVSDSQTALQIHPLHLDNSTLKLTAREYPKTWEAADEDILRLIDEELLNSQDLILLGNHDHENSLRILAQLINSNRDYVFLGSTPAPGKAPKNYRFSPSWQALAKENELWALHGVTLAKTADGWKMYIGRWEKLP